MFNLSEEIFIFVIAKGRQIPLTLCLGPLRKRMATANVEAFMYDDTDNPYIQTKDLNQRIL